MVFFPVDVLRSTLMRPQCHFSSTFWCVLAALLNAIWILAPRLAAVPIPPSNCFALDNLSRLVDFKSLQGKEYEYAIADNHDLVVRFCKNVETRSQKGYVNFGRLDQFNYLSGPVEEEAFTQRYYKGDLLHCEKSYNHLGRTSQVNVVCGSCSNGRCKGTSGCICNATFYDNCRVVIDLAIPCNLTGPRVFNGFTVGFHPRRWEIVCNGMTQIGFEKPYPGYSFSTDQTHVALYLTSIASLSSSVGIPFTKVEPENGLEISLSGTAAAGVPPTSLSPTTLLIHWRCVAVPTVYKVHFTIPIKGYDPVDFFLTKDCEFKQDLDQELNGKWVIIGILSSVALVLLFMICYKRGLRHSDGSQEMLVCSHVSGTRRDVKYGAV